MAAAVDRRFGKHDETNSSFKTSFKQQGLDGEKMQVKKEGPMKAFVRSFCEAAGNGEKHQLFIRNSRFFA